jgi:alanyl-tRNA synthetase
VRFARDLGVTDNFTKSVAQTFIDTYKNEYKNLLEKQEIILSELDKEESKFRKTLDNGMKQFEKVVVKDKGDRAWNNLSSHGGNIDPHKVIKWEISAETAFNLLQSFGFPIELTIEIAKEKGFEVDIIGFEKLKEEHSQSSRTASTGKFKGGLGSDGEMETKYHTATHLLHQALRTVLGDTVEQKGSNINNERLRFDFAYGEKMTDEQKKKVEDLVNEKIKANLPVIREELSKDEALSRGAIGLFGDKYGDVVSVYKIGEGEKRGDSNLFSMELCGGPHVSNTGELGIFKILKEEAVSSGVRRIKAVLS